MTMSASVTPNNQLKFFWDHFFHSETGTYEKSSWLDLFLAEYLIQLRDGCDPSSLLSFCPIGGIVTLVGCELLCGVHCVTSSSCLQFVHLAKNDFPRDCFTSLQSLHNTKVNNKDDRDNVSPILSISNTQNYSTIESNATSIQGLKNFLLKGSAWRCLALLQSLGVEGLSCSRQLSGVLVWLYGELSGAGGVCHGPNTYLPRPPEKPPVYDLYDNKVWTKKNVNTSILLRNSGNNNNAYGSHSRRRKRIPGKNSVHIIQEKQQHHSNARKSLFNHKSSANRNNKISESSDSEQNSDELELLNRSFTLKAKLNRNDFDYFSAVVRSEEDVSNDALYSPMKRSHQKKKPVIEDYISDKHREVFQSEISQYEFSKMAINLLYQLCKSETNTNDSEALHISVQCINFALKYLCTLQFESSPASHVNLTSSEATHLKTSLTELLILSFDKVLMHADLFNKIISNGILPMLLRLLEDATYKLQVRLEKTTTEDCDSLSQGSQEGIEQDEASNWAKYLFGISYSILVFFYCLLMQQNSLGKIHDFVEQFKLFGDCRRGFIVRDTINLMLRIPTADEQIVSTFIKKLIILINRLIHTLKLVRSELVHSASCPRNKHKICQSKVLGLMQHHHDVLGTSFCHAGNMSLSPVCSVSILYATLASLLSDDILIHSSTLRTKLLKCMRSCGSCCCFSPQFLLEKVVTIVRTHNSLANLCFLILEQSLYGELGVMYMSNLDTYNCSVCDNYFTPDTVLPRNDVFFRSTSTVARNDAHPRSILKHSLSENDNISNVMEYKVIWPFLSKYIPLLQGDNITMLHATMNHLLKMSSQCKHFFKHDLLFCVLYPAFVMAKSRYLLTNNDCSYFVTISCLNAFASLLGFPIFAKEFIEKGGLNDILDLIALPEFSKQCCSILEIATVTEIFNNKNEVDKLYTTKPRITTMSHSDIDKLPSLQMLIKSLETVTRKAFLYFKLKVDKTVYENIVNISKVEESPFEEFSESTQHQKVSNSISMPSVQSQPINIMGPHRSQTAAMFEMQHSSIEQSLSHHMEMLKSGWIFWKTCCALCLYSPILRKYFVKKKIFQDSFKMFKLLLHCVTKIPCTLTEHKILMRILEVIVTINVSVSDYTMEKSKLVTIELLQRVLISNGSECLDLNNVKLLCDMLVRVASTQPSNVQVMPPKNKIKLPPLQFSAHSDDEHMSSGEDEEGANYCQRKPYMSEGSDTYHSADEGYEADVEVGVVDSLSADAEFNQVFINSNSNSGTKTPVHSIINNIGSADIDYTEYRKLDVVTYPELCFIVLNVALSLIDRILIKEDTSPDANDSNIFNVVCSCLNKMSTLFFHDMSGTSVVGFITQILQSPSARLLKRRAKHLEDLQNSLLKLFETLAAKSITPNELKLYLCLLNDSKVPLKILLEPLKRLADTVQTNVPDFIVCFPVDAHSTAAVTKAGQTTNVSQNKDGSATQVEALALFLHREHGKLGIRSCWSKMGMWCPIDGVSWGLWLEGCSITMWMMLRDTQTHSRTQSKTSYYSTSDDSLDSDVPSDRQSSHATGSQSSHKSRRNVSHNSEEILNVHSDSETDILNILHLVSIGHDSVMIEFWVNVVNGDILIQLTRPASDCNNIIGEGVLKNCVNTRCWNHLTINIKELTTKKTFCIEVVVFVNGIENKTLVPLTGVLLHRVRPAYLIVGHSTPSDISPSSRPRGSWFLSNLSVFRSPILTKHTAMYLMAHGPDIKPLTSCQVGNQVPNFGPLFTPNVIGSGVDWDQVLDISSNSITQMQENLLLTYSACHPNNVDVYHQTTAHPKGLAFTRGIQSILVFRRTSHIKGGSVSIPAPRNVHWMGHCLSSQHSGFSPSIYLIGGPNILMYLYARVVELESNSEVQASALSSLLKVSLSDARLHSMFQQDELLNMLHIVFASKKCKVDHYLMKALIDASCDKSVLVKNNNVFHLMTKVNVIIKYPEILVAAMKTWRQFETSSVKSRARPHKSKCKLFNKLEDIDEELLQEEDETKTNGQEEEDKSIAFITEEDGLLGVLFQCINIMLRDENPYRQFNVYQLNRFNMVETLLMFCKERFLYSEFGQLSEAVSYGLVELIRSLMGCPPYMHHVALITDFLVLMHEYSSTYITHSRSSIYFLLTDVMVKNREKRGFEIFGIPLIQPVTTGEVEKPKSAKIPKEKPVDRSEGTPLQNLSKKPVVHTPVASTSNTSVTDPSTSSQGNKDIPKPTSTSSPLNSPSKCPRKMHVSNLSVPPGAELMSGVADSSSTGDSFDFTKEYDVVGSDEVTPEDKSPLMIYQKLRSPVLANNLRTCATRSWTICEGLLLLLRDTITIMPDTYLPQMLGIILGNEMLLVLANHPEASVRSAVVKVVGAILQRCSVEEVKRFHERNYFHNLANQISQSDASYELVSACTSLITGRSATIEDQLDEAVWSDVTETKLHLAFPLMAVLPPSLHDVSLTHNTSIVFRKIINLASIRVLVNIGMVESIVKCLRHIGSVSDTSFDGRELLLNDMRGLLNVILVKILLTDRNSHLHLDIYNMLLFVDMMERRRSRSHLERCHMLTVMRDTYCFLLREELNFYQELMAISYNERLGSPSVVGISAGSDQDISGSPGFSPPSSSGLSRSAPTNMSQPMNISSPRVRFALSPPEDPKNEYTRDELRDKIMALLKRAVAFFTNREWFLKISPYEITTIEIVFLLIVSISSGGNHHFRVKWWKKLMTNSCHRLLSDLFMWMISPKQVDSLKTFAVQSVFDSWINIKKILTPSDPTKQRKQVVYLTSLLRNIPENNQDIQHEDHSLKYFVESWADALEPQRLDLDAIQGEIKHLVDKDDEKRKILVEENFEFILKSVLSKEILVKSIMDSAMAGTQGVVNTRNEETKILINQIKKQDAIYVASCHKWQKLLDTFGHERGVWFDEESCPLSWELDPTEGPAKVRVRLRRCHIDIDKKFLKEQFKFKVDLAQKPQPLSYLFSWSMQSDYLDCLHMNEVISHMAPAVYVTVKSEQEGEVVLSDRCIHFFPDDKREMANVSGIYLPLDNIIDIQKRRWRLSERAVEIMLSSGHSHFLAFKETKEMENFLKILDNYHMPMRQDADTLSTCASLWRNGEITNWEYLMHLNNFAGRTYNDLMQYPVLPFILTDYISAKLDLGKSESFRNLKRPVAVQDPNHEKTYIDNYNVCKNLKIKNEERRKENPSNAGGFTDEPFHYGSHYSNSATVLHYLVRLPPFTKQFILFQDGNFDMPDRTFHSVNTAWKLAGCVSQSSCKELTPEFFYHPRIFTNDEGFNFGTRQCGIEVNHVELPKWCKNARIFTLVHRQALESPHVRENIPHWIDLIFGYKQTGDPAIESINMFHPSTYHGYKPTLADSVQREALDAMIRTYGQTPRQLLKLPHPQCITNLKHVPESVVEVLPTVSGLRWGYYCASPQQSIPWMVWIKKTKPVTEKLIPLTTGEVIGLPSQTTAIVVYAKSSAVLNVASSTSIASMAVITWGHSDGIIRIKQKKDVPPEPLFQLQDLDQVCVISHGIGSTMGGLWLGLQSGRIVVLQPAPVSSTPPTISFSRRPTYLFGHNSAITAICISTAFGVAVSSCKEGLLNVWDLHNLTLVRALPTYDMPLNLVCVSDTLCDVCTIYDIVNKKPKENSEKTDTKEKKSDSPTATTSDVNTPATNISSTSDVSGASTSGATRTKPKNDKVGSKSKIRIQTINGMFIAEMKIPERATSVVYSNAPEGISVNCIMVGLENGGVRLYSSWDLTPINNLIPLSFAGPLISMCYSYDAHYLYIAGYDGTVMVWESESIKGKTPGFRLFNALPIF